MSGAGCAEIYGNAGGASAAGGAGVGPARRLDMAVRELPAGRCLLHGGPRLPAGPRRGGVGI